MAREEMKCLNLDYAAAAAAAAAAVQGQKLTIELEKNRRRSILVRAARYLAKFHEFY